MMTIGGLDIKIKDLTRILNDDSDDGVVATEKVWAGFLIRRRSPRKAQMISTMTVKSLMMRKIMQHGYETIIEDLSTSDVDILSNQSF